jgi:phosphohistidine phosphatase
MAHRLLLLRHAKSDWPPGVPDGERPLAERGVRDAEAAGELLAAEGWTPDLVLCSTAERARRTWSLAAAALTPAPVLLEQPELYGADVPDVLRLVRAVEEAVGTLLVVGHQPTFSRTVQELAGDHSDQDALDRLREKFPTSGIAVLSVDVPWAQLRPGLAALERFEVPRG